MRGLFLTKQEAANRCGCTPLWLGGGFLRGHKKDFEEERIGHGGGAFTKQEVANSHIQQNTSEKTTAPTVLDCLHGIHWLRAAESNTTGTFQTLPRGGGGTATSVDSESQEVGTWEWPTPGTTTLLLKAGVSKAHKRIKILPSGWKYQVAQIDQQRWANEAGT